MGVSGRFWQTIPFNFFNLTLAMKHRGLRLISLACWLLIVIVTQQLLTSNRSLAQTAVTNAVAEATPLENFARLVFTFEKMPEYEVRTTTGVMVIKFESEVNVDVSRIARNLPEYLSAVRLDPDGRGIRIALTQALNINTMEAGKKLFIDFLPSNWVGLPPGLPEEVVAELAARAARLEAEAEAREAALKAIDNAPELEVEAGNFPTFSRISFGWDRPFRAKVTRDGKDVNIVFNPVAKVDTQSLLAARPAFLLSAKSETTATELKINLEVDEKASLRTFRDGDAFVLDLSDPEGFPLGGNAALDPNNPAFKSPGQSATRLSGEVQPEQQAPVNNPPSPLNNNGSQNQPVSENVRPLNPNLVPLQPSLPVNIDQTVQETQRPTPETPSARNPQPVQNQTPTFDLPERVKAIEQLPPDTRPQIESPNANIPVQVRASRSGENVRLQFPFAEPVPAAVFRRGEVIWILFDSMRPIQLGDLTRVFGEKLVSAEVQKAGRAQFIRLKLNVPTVTSAALETSLWTISIGDIVLKRSEPLELVRRQGPGGNQMVAIRLPNAGRVHYVRDPEIGDRLAIATAFGPARGLLKQQDFVEFISLASTHGAAIQPISDDLSVRIHIDELLIGRGNGLTLSAGVSQQSATTRRLGNDPYRLGYIDYENLLKDSPSGYSKKVRDSLRKIALAKPEKQNDMRLELAELFLAHGLGSEALGILTEVQKNNPTVENDPAFRALRGIANTLMHRPEKALVDLTAPGLTDSQVMKLWRGYAESLNGNWRSAQAEINAGQSALTRFPKDKQIRFHLAAAEAARRNEDVGDAYFHIEAAESLQPTGSLVGDLDLLRGRLASDLGEPDEALASFKRAARSENRYAQAAADLETNKILYEAGEIDIDEAIKRFETATVSWRGDELELKALQELTNLYLEKEDYRNAFDNLQTASISDPEAPIAREMYDQVSEVFKKLFLENEADKLPPFEALSLYYDYRVLTPVGRQGDEMIRNLADRLVDVDLLDQAAELLEHQVSKRLRGTAKSQVATRLAMIHMMNKDPIAALTALQNSRSAHLPEDIRKQRTRIEARALAETGRTDLALELIDTLDGEEAAKLKADTLWSARIWQGAAEQLERNLGASWQSDQPLNGAIRRDVMRAAIAYSLANDQLGLDRLSTKFAEKMRQSDDARAFEVVTRPVAAKGDEFVSLARSLSAVDSFEAFLEEYRASSDYRS